MVGTDIISRILNENISIGKQYIGSVKELDNEILLDSKTEKTIIDLTAEKIITKINENAPYKLLPVEIASLMAFKKDKNDGLSDKYKIALFYSDTKSGKFCADINEKVLNDWDWCEVANTTKITGLRTKKTSGEKGNISENFKNAVLNNLNKEVNKLLPKPVDDGENYFNITGGFKAVIPFSTIIAFNHRMSLMYLYEKSDDLIFISRPKNFNCPIVEVINNTKVVEIGKRDKGDL